MAMLMVCTRVSFILYNGNADGEGVDGNINVGATCTRVSFVLFNGNVDVEGVDGNINGNAFNYPPSQ